MNTKDLAYKCMYELKIQMAKSFGEKPFATVILDKDKVIGFLDAKGNEISKDEAYNGLGAQYRRLEEKGMDQLCKDVCEDLSKGNLCGDDPIPNDVLRPNPEYEIDQYLSKMKEEGKDVGIVKQDERDKYDLPIYLNLKKPRVVPLIELTDAAYKKLYSGSGEDKLSETEMESLLSGLSG